MSSARWRRASRSSLIASEIVRTIVRTKAARVDEVQREGVDVGRPARADRAHREEAAGGVAREEVADARAVRREQALPVREPALDLRCVGRPVRDHEAPAVLLVPAEGRDVVVAAVEDAGLARRRLRRRSAVPLHQPVAPAADPRGHPRRQPDADRVAQDRRAEPVDLDDQEAATPGDPRRLLRGQAAGELRVEGVVAVGGDDDRDERREDRDDEGRREGPGERGHLEAGNERCGETEHHRVDDEREEPDGHHVERQRQEDDHRPDEGVEEPEDDGARTGRRRCSRRGFPGRRCRRRGARRPGRPSR